MDYETFISSLKDTSPPSNIAPHLLSLWHDAHGDWEQAHEVVQNATDAISARIHAYLHRKEGDLWNARYWYNRAGVNQFSGSLSDEWDVLVRASSSVSQAA